jgi:AcrR family transcriptional regulator
MAFRKIIPIHDRETTQDKLVLSVGRIIAERGFAELTAENVAEEAKADRSVIFRTFGGLNGLVAAFGETSHFWPDVNELLSYCERNVEELTPGEVMYEFFRAYSRAILKRPQTLDIMARENLERNRYSRILEQVRVRVALEYFEHMKQDPPEEVDLTALVALVASAVTSMAVRSRTGRFFGGIDLRSEKGWQRIDKTLEHLFIKTLG